MLEKENQPVAPRPSEQETLRQIRTVSRWASPLLLGAGLLLVARFLLLTLSLDDGQQPYRMFVQLSYLLAAPILDFWPLVPRPGGVPIEYQSLVAAGLYGLAGLLLLRWVRASEREEPS